MPPPVGKKTKRVKRKSTKRGRITKKKKRTKNWKWPVAAASKPRKGMPARWQKRWGKRKKLPKFKKLTPCTYDLSDEGLCQFLIGFSEMFWPDYLQVREALFNVERRAFGFGTGGDPNKAMCGDGPGDDPPPPPTPPTFH
jgi:hypothetical protein